MTTSSVAMKHDDFLKISKRISHNYILSEYYEKLYEETNDVTHYNRVKSVDLCGKYMDFDYYRLQNVKALYRINLCRDKFCPNCQSLLAQRRLAKYKPVIDEYAKEYDLYHVVFTIPNCSAHDLKTMITLMYKTFGHIVRYFRGNLKIKGIDFTNYGFIGAIRSLEVTQNHETGLFHPHFHCIFILRKGLNFKKYILNKYSYNDDGTITYFSDFEVFLQKIWYLVFSGIKVTKEEIDNLSLGFDVKANELKDSNYKEIFKYAVKGCFKGDDIFTYESFKTLYYALHSRRMVQGYGALRVLNFEQDEVFEEEVDEVYNKFIEHLEKLEKPIRTYESLDEVLTESFRGVFKYVSRSSFRRVLRDTA